MPKGGVSRACRLLRRARRIMLISMDYEYFEYDNAFDRKRADSGLSAVDDVWFPTGWTPYRGDRQEKFMFGDRIDQTRLPCVAMNPVAEIDSSPTRRSESDSTPTTKSSPKTSESSLINLTGQAKGKAFQIYPHPARNRRT